MRVAVSANTPDLDADVDPRFGRCEYFILVDTDTMKFEAINNSGGMGSGGVGISTAQLIAGRGVEAILTGNCGPNAYKALSAAGIKVVTGVAGKVKDAVQSYKSGKLQASSRLNVTGHFGIGRGAGRGRGMHRGMSGR